MMNSVVLRLTVSSLLIGTSTVGCGPSSEMFRPIAFSAHAPKGEQEAAKAFDKAHTALQQGKLDEALALVEQAVEASPRDAGYRKLLAEIYLKKGRFSSAEATYADVVALNPGDSRAVLSLALTKIALGKSGAAVAQLDTLSDNASPADLGLAYALAGRSDHAIALLESAARSPTADGRVRQNLALAYALGGDWKKARATAARDLSPADLNKRLEQWAAFARPGDNQTQVASLLGVTPAEDAGQPVRLALAPRASETNAYAQVEAAAAPAPVEVAATEAEAETPAPVEVADETLVPPVEHYAAPVEAVQRYAEAADTLVTPQPAVLEVPVQHISAPIHAFEPRALRKAVAPTVGIGRYVVQLGAFSTPASVEKAWAQSYRRYNFGANGTPLSTTIDIGGRTLHRLSIAGFDSHDAAARVCSSVRAKGGECFVRGVAGDAPVRWASRYTRNA
jgi:Flp pilus assembly protein TadD